MEKLSGEANRNSLTGPSIGINSVVAQLSV